MSALHLTLRRWALCIASLGFCRLIFWGLNPTGAMTEEGEWISVMFYGLRFDLAAAAMVNLPVFFLCLLPFPFAQGKKWRLGHHWLFVTGNSLAVLANLVDAEYYKFTGKRSTADLFDLMAMGHDLQDLLPRFLTDFWYIPFLSLLLCFTFRKSDQIWLRKQDVPERGIAPRIRQSLILILVLGALVVSIRGGFQLRPIHITTASRHVSPPLIPYVLNTPFTLIKTLGGKHLPEARFFTEEQLRQKYPSIHRFQPGNTPPMNVVILIMESFSSEYTAAGGGNSHTPFLDSLMQVSTGFPTAFANGKKSIDGVPAILAGIPALMDEPFIASPFGGNTLDALPLLLRKKGYHTSFFHGGTNGTMGFDDFAALAGTDHYYGRKEYRNDADYDGHWGIYDHAFFPWFADHLSRFPQPFFSTFFSVSSHHPFTVPEAFQSRVIHANEDILTAISYADLTLRDFFHRIRHQSFYNNTLFVITADHTGMAVSEKGGNDVGKFTIPILYFHPGISLPPARRSVTQQIDILPSVLQLTGYDQPFFAIGRSIFSGDGPGEAITYINGIHQLITDSLVVQLAGGDKLAVFDRLRDPDLHHNLLDTDPTRGDRAAETAKAIIQQYSQAMIHNRLSYR